MSSIFLIFSAYRRAKALEDLQLTWINASLVLWMPLHGEYELPARMLKRFYGPIFGIERGYSQITGDRPHRLMMAGVHLPGICTSDFGEQRIRLDSHRVHRQLMADIVSLMAVRRIQMLDQRSTLTHVENLKAATDCEYRRIMRERFFH